MIPRDVVISIFSTDSSDPDDSPPTSGVYANRALTGFPGEGPIYCFFP